MSRRPRRRSLGALAGAIAIAAAAGPFVDAARAASATITLNENQVGVTPRYVGMNMGHYLPNSNTTAWLQYSQVNGYRVWASANDYEGADDNSTYGDGVTTLTQFNTRKANMRATDENPTYANWATFKDRFANLTQSGRNHVRLNTILGELHKSGVEPILNLTRTESYANVGWGGKWEQWQFTYVMAYHAAKNYDVQRFQWYNEPDQNASTITVADYADRLRVTSDAIRSAVADVNARFGKSLVADFSAPTTKNGASTFDTWGIPILQANRTDYAGNVSPVDIFDTYDLHRYNSLGSTLASDVSTIRTRVPQYNPSGAAMPVTFTEFNRYNTSTFSGRSDSLDTPAIFSEYANDYVGAMSADVKGLYAFKFSQTVWTDPGFAEAMKTGHYYVQDYGNNDISGATQGAEVARLVAKGFKGERPRLSSTTSVGATNIDVAATFDAARGNYHVLTVNRNTANASYDLALNLAGWNVAPGQIIGVQEVSADHHGSVSRYLTVGANKTVTMNQRQSSVFLLTLPSGATVQERVDLVATADAQVSNAAPLVNYGLAPAAHVARSATTSADDASYLKFNLAGTSNAKVSRAFLQLTGSNIANDASTTLHAYGILNDAWNELTINWNNAPDLTGASDARLKNVGTDAFPVGQFTWDDQANTWGIDVTEFVRKHPDADLSFVLMREERFLNDADTSRVALNTRESETGKPTLSLFLYDKPVHLWNRNGSGTWTTAGNWDVGATPGAVAVAVLGDFITAAQKVTVDSTRSVGELRFDSHHAYELIGAGGASLVLDGGPDAGATSAISAYKGNHKVDVPLLLDTPTTAHVAPGLSLTLAKPITGAVGLTKTGPGTLRLAAASPSFSGGTTINGGVVALQASDANAVTGLGTGPVAVNNATLRLENIQLGASGKPGPDLTLNSGATLAGTGTATFAKSGSPMIAQGAIGAPITVNLTAVAAGDTLAIASAFRNATAAGSSFATINVTGQGRVVLQSGGLAAAQTFSGFWTLTSGMLQLGPTASGTSEALNALGFKGGDARQANTITINGGTLIGAVNTPQDAAVTPNFFRANLTLSGGAVASSGVNANFGGALTTTFGTTSRVLVYDPLSPTTPRDVNFVGGAAGPTHAASAYTWIGNLTVSAGSLASGGALNISRTGGGVFVSQGATLQIEAGATVNLGGAADALSDGIDRVRVTNDSTAAAGGFNVTAGTKHIAALGGAGHAAVAAGATLVADHVRQARLGVEGAVRTRPSGLAAGTSNVTTLIIAPGGTFDLSDNKLVTEVAAGTFGGSAYDGVQGMVAAGRNNEAWDGSGLITSQSAALSGLTTLGVAPAGQVMDTGGGDLVLWSGQPVTSASTLVMYTHAGDANLDGRVDGGDYAFIDAYVGTADPAYYKGDFNYDGAIDGGDYAYIDVTVGSAPAFVTGHAGGAETTAPVPEPAAFSLIALAALPLFGRRKRCPRAG